MERRRHREGLLRDHADVMFWGALVSFVPVLLVLTAELIFKTPYPYYITLLWVFIFPVAVGYGIVRKQLFDVRWMAKSSAAYGAATLAITGVFAFLITSADSLVSRLNINLRWFQVSFLFVAILLFNPVRNRMQALVDRFFDRDRAAYRVAVREISEAMVSMLSLDGDRRPHPAGAHRYHGRRTGDGASGRRRREAAAPHGVARRLGTGSARARRSPPTTRSGSTCGCAARSSRARISTTSPTSRTARPAATSSTPSRSSSWCPSSTASICSA